MNKILSFLLLTFVFGGVLHAADFHRGSRVYSISGYGKGGTTRGDKRAACDRAYMRAEWDAEDTCHYDYDGWVLETRELGCSCRKKKGSKDDYNCEARVRTECEVERRHRH